MPEWFSCSFSFTNWAFLTDFFFKPPERFWCSEFKSKKKMFVINFFYIKEFENWQLGQVAITNARYLSLAACYIVQNWIEASHLLKFLR